MKVAIIGAGNVGRALAKALSPRHTIVFGAREAGEAVDGVPVLASAEAAADADAVILAVPYGAAAEALASAGDVSGKAVIDATNPLTMTPAGLGLSLGFETSGAEQIAASATGVSLFKTFNQTGFEVMANVAAFDGRPVMFVAGDDESLKPRVMELVADAGFEAVDAGPLVRARVLEPLASLWISLAFKSGHGRDFAFAFVRPR
jgi:hypothetical protein